MAQRQVKGRSIGLDTGGKRRECVLVLTAGFSQEVDLFCESQTTEEQPNNEESPGHPPLGATGTIPHRLAEAVPDGTGWLSRHRAILRRPGSEINCRDARMGEDSERSRCPSVRSFHWAIVCPAIGALHRLATMFVTLSLLPLMTSAACSR